MAADKAPRRSSVTGTRAARASRPPPPRPPLSLDGLWHNAAVRGLIYQVLVLTALCGLAAWMIGNAQHVLTRRGIATGFSFLLRESGFPISPSLIPYSAADSFMRAFAVGLLNTLSVSLASVVAATVLGVLIGIGRLSRNWIIARLAMIYVELFRNTPQLVQISFWYLLVTRLPPPRQAWNLAGMGFVSNRGVILAVPAADPVWPWVGYAVLIAAVAAVLIARAAIARRRKTGRNLPVAPLALALTVGIPALVWLVGGAPTRLDVPVLQGFNFRGGVTLPPEFIALFLGLSLYIAAFIAEIVRSGIQSVGRGQIEAARSIGLGRGDLYRKVILPQALRVIIPPAASQYVSLFKNSSLGVAIGYPELFNISNTVTTLSGHAIECVLIMAGTYLLISLIVAALMNAYNRAIQIRER
jgi:general L-amino acid transport system permease protein